MSETEHKTFWYRIRKKTSVGDPLERIKELALIRYDTTGKQPDFAVFSSMEYDETTPWEAYRLVYFSPGASKYCMTIIVEFYGNESDAPSRDEEEGFRLVVGDEGAAKALLM